MQRIERKAREKLVRRSRIAGRSKPRDTGDMSQNRLRRLESIEKRIKRRIVIALRQTTILFSDKQWDMGIFGVVEPKKILQIDLLRR
mgnify:CR=1 FL=1